MFKAIKKFFSRHSYIYPEEARRKITREYAISKAEKYGLKKEILYCLDCKRMWPIEALDEWDLLDYDTWS